MISALGDSVADRKDRSFGRTVRPKGFGYAPRKAQAQELRRVGRIDLPGPGPLWEQFGFPRSRCVRLGLLRQDADAFIGPLDSYPCEQAIEAVRFVSTEALTPRIVVFPNELP